MTSFLFSLMNFEQKINFLTSAGLIFLFFSFFCSTIKIAVHEIADGGAYEGAGPGGQQKAAQKKIESKIKQNYEKQFRLISFQKLFLSPCFQMKMRIYRFIIKSSSRNDTSSLVCSVPYGAKREANRQRSRLEFVCNLIFHLKLFCCDCPFK